MGVGNAVIAACAASVRSVCEVMALNVSKSFFVGIKPTAPARTIWAHTRIATRAIIVFFMFYLIVVFGYMDQKSLDFQAHITKNNI